MLKYSIMPEHRHAYSYTLFSKLLTGDCFRTMLLWTFFLFGYVELVSKVFLQLSATPYVSVYMYSATEGIRPFR
jgi:hypothetical protein